MVASVVVLPEPVGPVITIMPCGSISSLRSSASSSASSPSLPISSRPRSRGSRRITADSPYCVGMVATRTSNSVRATRTRAAPSCGRRRSAMLRPARILMREISACGSTPDGVGTARSRPSTRMRTTRPVRNGSMWMSVARSSMARSSRSLTARTTGAPLARSRKDSTSSSARAEVGLLAVGRGFVILAEPLGQDGRNVLIGADLDLDRTAEHDLGGAHRRLVGRVGEHQPAASAGALIRKHQGLAQEAARELGRQRLRGNQLRQPDPGQAVEAATSSAKSFAERSLAS